MVSVSSSADSTSSVPSSPGRSWPALGVAILVAAALAPMLLSGYQTFQLAQLLILFIALQGLNLLTGYCGQISLGHGAFFALGAYTAVVLLNAFGSPWWLALPAAALVAYVVGFAFGWPALRLQGVYLALATFALAVAVPQLLKHEALSRWTGGVQGINLPPIEPPGWWRWGPDYWFYLVCLFVAVLTFFLFSQLIRSRMGRAIAAIREQPTAAIAMGVNRAYVSSVVMGISAAAAGVAGALGAFATQFIAPDSFHAFLSISLLVGVIVGGLGTRIGPLFGAVFVQFMPRLSEEVSKAAPWAIYGIALLLVIYLAPGGVAGRLRALGEKP